MPAERRMIFCSVSGGACRRTLIDHDIDAIVFHSRVEILLDYRRQTVYLVDEQHVAWLERGENTSQVARLIEHWAGGNLKAYAEFVGDDVRQGGLTKSWRAVKQRVVERFATIFCSLNKHLEVLYNALLTAEVMELQRA